MKEIVLMIISQIKKEIPNDWLVLKITTLMVLSADFLGLLKGLVGTYHFDTGVISAVVVMMFADVMAGMYKAIKTATFDGKKLGNGILKKLLKYGIVIVVLVQLMNLTYGEKHIPALKQVAFLFYVGIIGMELDSICGNVFGVKFSHILNKGIRTISKVKEAVEKEPTLETKTP